MLHTAPLAGTGTQALSCGSAEPAAAARSSAGPEVSASDGVAQTTSSGVAEAAATDLAPAKPIGGNTTVVPSVTLPAVTVPGNAGVEPVATPRQPQACTLLTAYTRSTACQTQEVPSWLHSA